MPEEGGEEIIMGCGGSMFGVKPSKKMCTFH
jgi:hypothetical protein